MTRDEVYEFLDDYYGTDSETMRTIIDLLRSDEALIEELNDRVILHNSDYRNMQLILEQQATRLKAADELNRLCHEVMEIDDETSKEYESKILEIQSANWAYTRAKAGETK